jgi:transposase
MFTSLSAANDLIERQALQIEELTKKLHSSELNLNKLQHQVEQLLRRIYGRRSEKLDPNQLMFESLLLEAILQPASDPEPLAPLPAESQKPAVRTKRNHPGRIPIPDHLERVEIVLDLPFTPLLNFPDIFHGDTPFPFSGVSPIFPLSFIS